MKFLTYLFIGLILLSCAHTNKSTKKIRYSDEVERSFQDIEKEKAVELYRKLRWKKRKRTKRKRIVPKVTRKRERLIRKKNTRPALSKEKIKELKIEISQNMSFYCMQNRKSKRYPTETDCHAFTQSVLDRCQSKVSGPWVDRKIVRCVKSKLH